MLGLYVWNTPAVSLHIPSGWKVATEQRGTTGELALQGPGTARFDIRWGPRPISQGCLGDCSTASGLAPVDATLDGSTVTLHPFPWFPPTRDGGVFTSSLLFGPFEHDVHAQPVYFTVFCHPAGASAHEEKPCANIVSSIGWSAPLFARLHADTVAVPIS